MPEGLDSGSTETVYPGRLDLKNRYTSNVIIIAGPPTGPEGCSGVLLSRDRVLTAAHCVCEKRELTLADRKELETRLGEAFSFKGKDANSQERITAWKNKVLGNARILADASRCQGQVEVEIIEYLAATRRFVSLPYKGIAVRPHPRFLGVDDEQRHGLFKEADLAIIQLDKAVTESFRAIHLPTAEVYRKQRVIMVGYGLGETEYPTTQFGFRHFGESEITKIEQLNSGSTRFSTVDQEPTGHELSRSYGGDSGGGGFSQADDTVLVGIISARVDGKGAVFESVYPHAKWLRQEGSID